MNTQTSIERGEVNPLVVITIVLGVLVVGLGGFSIWSFVNYSDQKNNVDQKVEQAVSAAKLKQSQDDEVKFADREKQPNKQFVGPEDLGRVEFNYPKTWSGFVEKSQATGYEAYFMPGVVPPLNSNTPYALRITIENKSYESVIDSYQEKVKKGELRSTPVTIQGENGNRLEGKFSKDIDGVMVIFKVRDKTLRVYTESRTFQPDFENIILKSLIFNR
jgi:cytoskeletal protein RodZ